MFKPPKGTDDMIKDIYAKMFALPPTTPIGPSLEAPPCFGIQHVSAPSCPLPPPLPYPLVSHQAQMALRGGVPSPLGATSPAQCWYQPDHGQSGVPILPLQYCPYPPQSVLTGANTIYNIYHFQETCTAHTNIAFSNIAMHDCIALHAYSNVVKLG